MIDSDCISLLFLYIFQYIYSSKISLIQYFFKFLFLPFLQLRLLQGLTNDIIFSQFFLVEPPHNSHTSPTNSTVPVLGLSLLHPKFTSLCYPLPCPEHHATSKRTVSTTYTTVATTKTPSSELPPTNNSSSIYCTNTTENAK